METSIFPKKHLWQFCVWRTINLTLERSQIRLILGILISLAALLALIGLVDGREVLNSFKQINPVVILPVLLLLVISLLTRAAAWRIILKERISLPRSFLIINAGYFVNTVLPFRIGEIARAFLLLPAGLSFWEAFPTILLERIFDIGFALSLFFIGLPFAAGFSQGKTLAYLFAGLIILGLILLYLIARNHQSIIRGVENSSLIKPRLKGRLLNLANAVLESLRILTDPRRLVKVFLLMFASWIIALFTQYMLLRAFIPEAKLIWTAFSLGGLALGISIPSSPGNIGIYEASLTAALSAFGVNQSIAFAYALASHVTSVLVTTLVGSYGLVREGFALKDIWKLRQEKRKLEL